MNADTPKVHERRIYNSIHRAETDNAMWVQAHCPELGMLKILQQTPPLQSCHQKKGHTLIFRQLCGSFYLPDSDDPITLERGKSGLRLFPII